MVGVYFIITCLRNLRLDQNILEFSGGQQLFLDCMIHSIWIKVNYKNETIKLYFEYRTFSLAKASPFFLGCGISLNNSIFLTDFIVV